MHYYAKLAKTIADSYVRTQQLPHLTLPNYPELHRQRACYIHIYENPGHRLRALAGYPLPKRASLEQELLANTLFALEQSRRAIRRADLPSLTYAVSILEPLQRISSVAQLTPDTHGLYLQSDQGKVAVILPHRPGIDTPQDQVATAMREANINPHQEVPVLYRFAATYYE